MTKKQLNRIKTVAYEEFISQYTPEQLATQIFNDTNIVSVWKLTEGTQNKIIITQHDTQINTSTLRQEGFTENATVKKLFMADRQTKSVEFVGNF